jgi:hypothetical protein
LEGIIPIFGKNCACGFQGLEAEPPRFPTIGKLSSDDFAEGFSGDHFLLILAPAFNVE